MPQSDSLPVAIGALATAIARGLDTDEIALLAAIFSQLGDGLAVIAAARV